MNADKIIEQARLAIRWAESVKAGKPIQLQARRPGISTTSQWVDCGSWPIWWFGEVEYREKPEPRRVWVLCYDNMKTGSAYTDKAEAQRHCNSLATGWRVVEFVEVEGGESWNY